MIQQVVNKVDEFPKVTFCLDIEPGMSKKSKMDNKERNSILNFIFGFLIPYIIVLWIIFYTKIYRDYF